MKEYIEREAVLEIVKRTSGDYVAAWSEIAHMLAADVAPVVRCRECVHNHPEFVKNEAQWCELCRITINPDDFCSRGERKETPTCYDGVCEIPGVEREEDYE